MSDESHPRILYVGNLDPSVTEEFLIHLFGQMGSCKGCKIIHEAGNDLYAFVEFNEHSDAQMALMAMNKRNVLGKEMKVNWATSPGNATKQDTTNHFHVFVGDMSQEIETQHLRDAFTPFGQISDCKVIRDPQTLKSKGFGFVVFVKKEDAEIAIASMNGQWMCGRCIRTGWANGKANVSSKSDSTQKPRYQTLNYDDVFNQTSAQNTTVYCGGITADLTDQLMRDTFGAFGTVIDIRIFPEKGYAFIKLDSKEAAARAITDTHGTDVNGYTVKCSWGKEGGDQRGGATGSSAGVQQQNAYNMQAMMMQNAYGYGGYNYGYYPQQMGYWGYPPQQQGYGPPPPPPPPQNSQQQPQQQQQVYGQQNQNGFNMQQQQHQQQSYNSQGYSGDYNNYYGMQQQQQQQPQQQQQWSGSGEGSWGGQSGQ